MNWTLLLNSLLVAGAVALLAVGLGFAVALWLACLRGAARGGLLAACIATAALPPFLVVNSWIDLFGRTGSMHLWLPFELYSFTGCVVLLTALFWPIAALLIHAAGQRRRPGVRDRLPKVPGSPAARRRE